MRQKDRQLKEKVGQPGLRQKQERVKRNCAQLKERKSVMQDQEQERVKRNCTQLKERTIVQCAPKQQKQVDARRCGLHWCVGEVPETEQKRTELQDQ